MSAPLTKIKATRQLSWHDDHLNYCPTYPEVFRYGKNPLEFRYLTKVGERILFVYPGEIYQYIGVQKAYSFSVGSWPSIYRNESLNVYEIIESLENILMEMLL